MSKSSAGIHSKIEFFTCLYLCICSIFEAFKVASAERNQLPQTSPHTPNNFPEFFLSYLSIHRLVLSQRYGLSASYLSSVIGQAILPGLKSAAYNHTRFSHQTAPAMLYHFLRSSSKKTVSRVSLTILHRFSATSSSGLCYWPQSKAPSPWRAHVQRLKRNERA
jgi:hypothetical protein